MLYVERSVNTGHGTVGTIVLTLAGIWAVAAINLRGIRSMGQIQLWTSIVSRGPWRPVWGCRESRLANPAPGRSCATFVVPTSR